MHNTAHLNNKHHVGLAKVSRKQQDWKYKILVRSVQQNFVKKSAQSIFKICQTDKIKLVKNGAKNSFAYFQKKSNRVKKGPKISVDHKKPSLQGLVLQIFKILWTFSSEIGEMTK